MSDLASVYEDTRRSITELVKDLSDEQLAMQVPATPEWTIIEVIAHLTGDAAYVIAGDIPDQFFQAFGSEEGVRHLNQWTERMVAERRGRSLPELLDEWDEHAQVLVKMFRGEPGPALPPFGERVLVTDIGVHQQDIYGALGIKRDRDGPPIRIGLAGYVAMVALRAAGSGLGPIAFVTPEKTYATGDGEPHATVEASRWEFFRALSGRRSMEQIRAYRWTGDPEPYIPLFFPYGIRETPLVED